MQHTLKYMDQDMAHGIIRAIGTIMSESLVKNAWGMVEMNNKDQWNDTNILCQDNPIFPCIFDLEIIEWSKTDIYTMDIKEDDPIVHIAGGYVFGNFKNILFPMYNPHQCNFITDTFAASFGALMKEDFTGAYAMMRLGQLLESFAIENAKTLPQTDGNKREFQHKLFKI